MGCKIFKAEFLKLNLPCMYTNITWKYKHIDEIKNL